MDAVFRIVQNYLGENWIDLALWLELNNVDILEIKRETSLRWQSHTVLEKWRQQRGKEATVQKLLEALRGVGRQDLEEKVKEELFPETANSHSQVKLERDCTSRNQGTFIGTDYPLQNNENTTKPKTKRKNSKLKRFATRQKSTSKSDCRKSNGQNLSNIKVKHLEFAVNAVKGLQFAKQMHLRCCYLRIEAFTAQVLVKDIESAADRLEQEARDQISQFYNANKDLCKAAIMKVFKRHKILRNDLEIAKMWPSSIYVQTILKSEECVTALNEYQENGQLATDLQPEFENIGFCYPLQVAVLSTEQLEREVAGIVGKTMDVLLETDDMQGDVSSTDLDYLTSPSIAKEEGHVESNTKESFAHEFLQRNAPEDYDDEVFNSKVIEEVSTSRKLTGRTSLERRTLDQDVRTAKQAWDEQDDSEDIKKAVKMVQEMTAELHLQLEAYGQFDGEDFFEFDELLTDTSDSELEEESAKVIEEVLGKGKLSQRILEVKVDDATDTDEETSRHYEDLKDTCSWIDALLRITAWTGDEDKVKTLLQAGVQVNTVNSDGETPLWDAVKGGHTNIVSLLLQAGANANTADKNGSTPLLLATSLGNRAVCKALIHGNADVNTADRQQRTPLEMAIRNTDWPILTTLIRAGADVNKTPGTFGDHSPLSLSVKELMGFEKGISSDGSFEEDYSGEWYAEWYEHVGVFEALVRAGAKINSTDKLDQTLLLSACEEGCEKTAKLLLDNGADADKPDNRGRTALYVAAQKGHEKIVSILTQENADLNKADTEQKTPLWIAARKGHVKIVQTLIEAGADISLQDNTGMTPLHAALQMKKHAVVSMLVKHAFRKQLTERVRKKSTGFHTTEDFEYG